MLRRMALWMIVGACSLAPARLWADTPAPEQATKKQPALVIRLASIDQLVSTGRYLAEASGHEDQAKGLEDMIKNAAGPKGLEGIDTKKPLGAYLYISPQGAMGIPDVVVLIPYTEEKAVLDLIERQGQKAEKEDDGTYVVKSENAPFPVYLRFANKYLYGSNSRERLGKDSLLTPAAVLPPGQRGTAEVLVRISEIPKEIKELALTGMENRLAKEKDSKKQETEAESKLRSTFIDEVAAGLKSVLLEGGDLNLSLDLDKDASDLSLSLSLSGQDGSKLAQRIARMGEIQSLAAGLVGKGSAFNFLTYFRLPEALRDNLMPVLEEQEKKAVAREKDATKRELGDLAWKALKPTLQEALLDAGFDLRGPASNGRYTLVAGMKVKDGKDIDQLVRKVKSKMPEDNEDLKLDVAKEGSISIHQVQPRHPDANTKKAFGDKPAIYFAVREDAVLMSMGEDALAALKEVLGTTATAGRVFQMEMAFSNLAPLMTDKYQSVVETAKQTLKEKGSDKVRIVVEGGKTLKLRLGMKSQLLAFFGKLQERGAATPPAALPEKGQ